MFGDVEDLQSFPTASGFTAVWHLSYSVLLFPRVMSHPLNTLGKCLTERAFSSWVLFIYFLTPACSDFSRFPFLPFLAPLFTCSALAILYKAEKNSHKLHINSSLHTFIKRRWKVIKVSSVVPREKERSCTLLPPLSWPEAPWEYFFTPKVASETIDHFCFIKF